MKYVRKRLKVVLVSRSRKLKTEAEGHRMEAALAVLWFAVVLFVCGCAYFLYYLRTGKRWAWGVAVTAMCLAIILVWLWWR